MVEGNEIHKTELREALKFIYPIRDKLQKNIVENFNEELFDKIISLNKIIDNAEFLLKLGMEDEK